MMKILSIMVLFVLVHGAIHAAQVKTVMLDSQLDPVLAYHLGLRIHEFKILWPRGVRSGSLHLKYFTRAADGTFVGKHIIGQSDSIFSSELEETTVRLLFSKDGRMTKYFFNSMVTIDVDMELINSLGHGNSPGRVIGNKIILRSEYKDGTKGYGTDDMEAFFGFEYDIKFRNQIQQAKEDEKTNEQQSVEQNVEKSADDF
ncbi:MAG: hypothetical protein HRU15_03890 [Planctomycetes bacterium]|nr:hypothetical protein [Planctomycetota bacterium]